MSIQNGDHCLEGLRLLRTLQVEVFQKSPGRSSQATDDIQQRFTSSLCEGHLAVVDVNSLPPLLVVCGLPGEEWDETVSG